MLNLTELEKVVAVLKAKENFLSPQVSALLEFAELALSLKEMPQDKKPSNIGCGQTSLSLEDASYNQRGLDDKAWLTAKLIGLEDTIGNWLEGKSFFGGKQKEERATELSQAIREHFTGEGR